MLTAMTLPQPVCISYPLAPHLHLDQGKGLGKYEERQ